MSKTKGASKSKGAKRLARNHRVPQSREECDAMILQIGESRRVLTRLETVMNDEIAKVKARHEQAAAPLREHVQALFDGIEDWCEANRLEITQGGKVKFAKFGNGEVKWRQRPPRVTVRNVEAVLASLKDLGLKRFIRVKEEVNREAIQDEPEAVAEIKGITIGSAGEDFAIEPFEQELANNTATDGRAA